MVHSSDIRKANILIVDDQPANVMLLERLLWDAAYVSVTSTSDPTEVRELHRANRYDLILLDLQMPKMDGFQVMENLRDLESGGYLPVIVITAQPDHKVRALKAGARDFVSKPFELAEVLTRVYNYLETRLLQVETRRLYDQIVLQQKLSERLLLNVLPFSIAQQLKDRPEVTADTFAGVIADSFLDATVLFADIVDFTKLSEGLSAQELVAMLNEVFSDFDRIVDENGVEKIKTIGDCYMAVAGLPIADANHAARAADTALEMLGAIEAFNLRTGYKLQIRIGLCSGPGVAGVIGKRKFIYDVWGDVVNTASRMESHGLPGHIQVSETTRRHLHAPFLLQERGQVHLKGKGDTKTWFLCGRAASAELVTFAS